MILPQPGHPAKRRGAFQIWGYVGLATGRGTARCAHRGAMHCTPTISRKAVDKMSVYEPPETVIFWPISSEPEGRLRELRRCRL